MRRRGKSILKAHNKVSFLVVYIAEEQKIVEI